MKIQEITLEQALPVRHEVLWPDKPVEFCIVEGDEEAVHLGALLDGYVVSVASLYLTSESARLRKFATLHAYQGRGIGTALLGEALQYLQAKRVRYFWCDARESAIGFYHRFGMEKEGPRFFKSDVAYYRMGIHFS